jgi:hypothetical protein
VDPPFLSLLFSYRETLRDSIARAIIESDATVSIVDCWVDELLANLGEATIKIAGGIVSKNSMSLVFGNLQKQSEENRIQAAAQLPRRRRPPHQTYLTDIKLRDMATRSRRYQF